MRDRLIELLKKDPCQSPFNCDPNCKYTHLRSCLEERLADYLLANGVIVPPCKVGETIYTAYWKVGVLHVTAIEIRFETIGTEAWVITDGGDIRFEDFGKKAFLTREEAEQALKGGD